MILDTNCFGRFFDKDNTEHDEFIPALRWVMEGAGKLMFGGTKYLAELKNANKYIKFFSELSRAGKTIRLDCNLVDAEERKARKMEPNPDFDDPHLVALVIVGNCRIICSADKRSIKYLKDKKFYPSTIKRPLYYMRSGSKGILCKKNIAPANLEKYYNIKTH